jgi:hypothetical protein
LAGRVLLKIVYLLTCRVLGLAVLVFRGDRAKAAELLVLRHDNAVLRGSAVNGGRSRRCVVGTGQLRSPHVGPVAARSCCTLAILTLKCQSTASALAINVHRSGDTPLRLRRLS